MNKKNDKDYLLKKVERYKKFMFNLYGEEGLKYATNKLRGSSLKILRVKYGNKYKEKYKENIEKQNGKGNLLFYINKYGEIEGKEKYLEKNKKLSVNIDVLKKNGFTDFEIKKIKEKHSNGSRISKEHFVDKYGEKEGTKKYSNWMDTSKARSSRCKEYWINKGFSEEEAKEKVKITQTRDLSYFINKYGEDEGTIRFSVSSKKKALILDNFTEKYGKIEGLKRFNNIKNVRFSKIEMSFINEIIKNIYYDNVENLFYGENQFKFGIRKDEWTKFNKKVFYVDFLDKNSKKIIEFNGDLWHGNPNIFKDDDKPNPFSLLSAKEIREKDQKRYDFYKDLGYEVLVVWEDDYVKNKEEVLEKTKIFLRSINESNNRTEI